MVSQLTFNQWAESSNLSGVTSYKSSSLLRRTTSNYIRKNRLCCISSMLLYRQERGKTMRRKKLKLTDDRCFEIAMADICAGTDFAIAALGRFGGRTAEYYAGLTELTADMSDDEYCGSVLALRDRVYRTNGIGELMEEAYIKADRAIERHLIEINSQEN